MTVQRLPTGQIDVVYTTNGPADGVRSQLVGFAAIGVGIIDWTSTLPEDSQLGAFQDPDFRIESTNVATEGGTAISPQAVASRAFLGIVFVVLLFMTVIIYGMWVATGVAAEKSSRVMELMISAASPRQLLAGKVAGIGGAGLTQYVAIVVPALVVLAFQDQIAEAILGPAWAAGTPLVGLTPGLLVGYGVFFLLGLHAVRADLRLDGLVRQPAGRPADPVAAAQLRGGRGLPVGDPGARRRRRRVDDRRVVPAAIQPVRDARPPDDRRRAAVAGGAVDRDPDRRRSWSWPSSRPGCTRPASCSTASAPASAPSSRRPAEPGRDRASDRGPGRAACPRSWRARQMHIRDEPLVDFCPDCELRRAFVPDPRSFVAIRACEKRTRRPRTRRRAAGG